MTGVHPPPGTDLRADDVTIAGKTGTFLHLRHEIGVVTHHTTRVAMAALTASRRTARIRADVDLAIGHAARDFFEALRRASFDHDRPTRRMAPPDSR